MGGCLAWNIWVAPGPTYHATTVGIASVGPPCWRTVNHLFYAPLGSDVAFTASVFLLLPRPLRACPEQQAGIRTPRRSPPCTLYIYIPCFFCGGSLSGPHARILHFVSSRRPVLPEHTMPVRILETPLALAFFSG